MCGQHVFQYVVKWVEKMPNSKQSACCSFPSLCLDYAQTDAQLCMSRGWKFIAMPKTSYLPAFGAVSTRRAE